MAQAAAMESHAAEVSRAGGVGRTVGLAWMCVFVPLLLMGLAAMRAQGERPWLHETDRLQLPAALRAGQVGFDRRGGQMAALCRDGSLHVVTARAGRLGVETLPTAWMADNTRRTRLALLDTSGDDLIDICVIQRIADPSSPLSRTADELRSSWRTATYIQRNGGFQLVSVGLQTPARSAQAQLERLYAAGVSYSLSPAVTAVGSVTTQLVRDVDKRLAHAVQGEPAGVIDFNQDGHQDLLTVEVVKEPAAHLMFRLFVYGEGRFRQVWQFESESIEEMEFTRWSPASFIFVADFDQDTENELIVADPQPGVLSLWELDPAL